MKCLFIIILLLGDVAAHGQDPTRFIKKVEQLSNKEYNFSLGRKLVVFTGSSSIVRWRSVQADFPDYDVINNGFGGSVFSDLLHFYDELIRKPKPDILFIYEGDNDVARGKKVKAIYEEAKQLHTRIRKDLPKAKVIFISPKPCIANWSKKDII